VSRRKKIGVGPQHSARDLRRSMVQVQIGQRVYDAVYISSCRTCTSPARMLIEEKILQNFSFRAIAEQFSETVVEGENGHPQTLPRITHQSIYGHFHNGHMPLEAATLRRLAEKRARSIGADYEAQAEQFVDHVVLAEATVARVYERMAKGEIEPEVKDGLAAAKMIAEIEATTSKGLDAEAWSDAMQVYFETAQQFMDPTTWGRFTRALSVNPILRALEKRLNPDPTVIDALPAAIEGAAS
jgi:hypothetical protein